jgi:perosamine synthetase
MERIDALIGQKRAIFHWYQSRLSGLPNVGVNAEPPDVFNSYWIVTAVPDPALGLDKFALMAELDKRNIDSRLDLHNRDRSRQNFVSDSRCRVVVEN